MRAGGFEVEPFGALAYVNLDTEGFTEKGGAAALTGMAGDQSVTFTNLGARFGTTMLFGFGRTTVHGMVAWQHALDPVTPTSTLASDGGAGVPFTVAGIPIATDALRLEAGFDWALSDRASLALAYSGQIAAHVQDHGLKAKLSVRF
jgi:subtilase-type serine protease